MKDRVQCAVCGAVSRRPEDLCEAQPSASPCDASRGPLQPQPDVPPDRAANRRVLHALEILFCPSVYERARYSCEACGRLAFEEGLVCLPHERKQ